MLGTMPECSTMSDQILQYDQALAAPIIVPIGIIACRGRHFHLACEIMIEAGFERADVNIVESRSEEHTSELQSLMRSSYAVFCLKKKKKKSTPQTTKKTNISQN